MRQLLLLALAASASGLASLFQPARPPLRARSCAAQEPGGQEPGEPEAKGPLAEAKESWRRTRALVAAFSVPRIEEDDLPEAVALHKRLEQAKAGGSADVGELSRLTAQYYRASYERVVSRPAVKEGLPVFFSAANGAIALLVLRLLLPRLLAIESMGDLYDLAPELGLPTKEELATYIDYAQALDLPTKFGLFLLIICAEKVTLVGEILPVGVVLPSLSPVLFGGVLQGTLISAFCAAVGSSLNFVLGKSFLYERVRNLEIFGQPPVKDTTWYRALSANIEKDGFKAALLLRLAPVLPIPIDAHWYVSGCTPLKLPTFFVAYFVGALKATFLDAYLGSLLLSGLSGSDSIEGTARVLIVAETVGILLVSILVTQYATGLFQEMMAEEGFTANAEAEEEAGGGAEGGVEGGGGEGGVEGGGGGAAGGDAGVGVRRVEAAEAALDSGLDPGAGEAAAAEAALEYVAAAAAPPASDSAAARRAELERREAEIVSRLAAIDEALAERRDDGGT